MYNPDPDRAHDPVPAAADALAELGIARHLRALPPSDRDGA